MNPKLIRITTVPISMRLFSGQTQFMQENGFQVYLASSHDKDRMLIEKETGIRIKELPLTRTISPINDIFAMYKTYKYFKTEKPDIVHSHTPKAGLVGMVAAMFARVPIRMHTVAGLPLMESKGIKRMILNMAERITSFAATNIYPNSIKLNQFMISYKLAPKRKLSVIGNGSTNGINLNRFSSDKIYNSKTIRESVGINNNDFVFLFVGRIVADKGVNELLTAFDSISKRHSNVKLLLVGEHEESLDPLSDSSIKILEKNKSIIQTGYQNDVRPFFDLSDVFVFPSYREGFPNVVMQAGAMGLSSIVSDINGNNELIKNEFNGLIIPVKNSVVLLEKMELLLTNEVLGIKLASQARKMIEEKYDQNHVWTELLKEYKRLLKLI